MNFKNLKCDCVVKRDGVEYPAQFTIRAGQMTYETVVNEETGERSMRFTGVAIPEQGSLWELAILSTDLENAPVNNNSTGEKQPARWEVQ